jgi:hypothetical protein
MPSDTISPVVVILASLVGSGVGTTIIGVLFKKRFDTQLETHKALLQRTGKIHEKQVDSLLLIHSKLNDGLFYLQRATGAGKLRGEASDEEFLNRMAQNLADANAEFAKSRLLISESLGQKLDDFFGKMFSGGITYNLALDPMVQDGNARAKLVDDARQVAYKELPSLLNAIRDEARKVIHG